MSIQHLIRNARRGISSSGAGLSVASGLPAYRGPGGIWAGNDHRMPTEAHLQAEPAAFWRFFRRHWLTLPASASPNPGHEALVALEQAGCLCGHITQNVDGLIATAGSRQVIELHGRSSPVPASHAAAAIRRPPCTKAMCPGARTAGACCDLTW